MTLPSVGSDPTPIPKPTVDEAKARLLAWADEREAARKAAPFSVGTLGTMAVSAGVAAAGALAVGRLLSPRSSRRDDADDNSPGGVRKVGKALVNGALVMRAAKWAVPLAGKFVRDQAVKMVKKKFGGR